MIQARFGGEGGLAHLRLFALHQSLRFGPRGTHASSSERGHAAPIARKELRHLEEKIMGTYEAAIDNLEKAMMNWRPPQPWRSGEESEMIRRLVFWWQYAMVSMAWIS